MRPARLLVLAALALIPLGARAADGAGDKAHKLIEAFKSVKAAPTGGKLSDAEKAANEKAFKAIDAFFDYDAFTSSCLGPNAAKLEAPQQKEFKERMVDLVRRTGYPNGGEFFSAGVVTEGKAVEKNGATWVPVKIFLKKEDITTEIGFVYGKDLKVIDLAIDGDVLTKDYQNQIGRVLGKGGPADLLKRLADKQKKLDEAQK